MPLGTVLALGIPLLFLLGVILLAARDVADAVAFHRLLTSPTAARPARGRA